MNNIYEIAFITQKQISDELKLANTGIINDLIPIVIDYVCKEFSGIKINGSNKNGDLINLYIDILN